MKKDHFITENHKKVRSLFRFLGPVFLITGVICLIIATADLFTSQGFEGPKYFWLAFVGVPLIFIGVVLSSFGYGGAVAKYQSREYAPVAKDSFNYLANKTNVGVREISKAIREGANSDRSIVCNSCKGQNPENAKFCTHCGKKLVQICSQCEQENHEDSSYCHRCGFSLR